MSTFKKHNCLNATYRNILVNNTKIFHTDNNVKKLKILEALYIQFRRPIINRINFEASDNILKCLKKNNPYYKRYKFYSTSHNRNI